MVAALLLTAGLQAVEIPKGTHVLLRMVNSVSSRTAKPGDHIYMTTGVPISIEGKIVVPVNSYVQGVVAHSRRAGKVRGRAQLGIRLETLTLADGRAFKFAPVLDTVDPNQTRQAVDRKEGMVRQAPEVAKDAGEVAILAGAGASIGGLSDRSWSGAGIGAGAGAGAGIAKVLLTRGRDVELAAGTALDVVLDRGVKLE
jgi:type IV secretion system protein VirB10